jgi:dienelactone hydrolase
MIHSASGISRRQFIGAAGTAVAGSMLSAPLVTGGLFRVHAQQGEAAGAGVPELRYGQEMALRYLEREVAKIETAWLSGVGSIEEWERRRREYRRQYAEMLGLWPMPPRTALQPTITGRLEHSLFTVEKLHFQSLPGVYVTANLYLPKQARGRVPVVLYLCGHARSIEEEVSFGNKAAYQHHPSWYARHGIASLIIDTLHGGEILAFHHGTHHLDRWWWNNRGYTPAGVEAWNAIRALDYLETRPEIDAGGMAVTGRSGGGAYSWSVLALDDRIITSVPTAGITDLRNYVGDQRVDTHCDCMFMVNTYRWDFPLLAALAAPRPVLLANTDSDRLFPVDGIRRLEEQVQRIYRLYGQEAHWRIYIGPGRHEDTPDLQLEAFTWIHRHLIGSELENPQPVASFFEPRDLRVFGMLPVDERNTRIDEEFIPLPAEPAVPASAAEWESLRQGWLEQLSAHSFSGWPEASMPLRAEPCILFAYGFFSRWS